MKDEKDNIHNSLKNFTLKSIINIQKAKENRKLVIFVGAGVSRNSGISTWADLVKQLARDLGINPKAHDADGFSYYGGDDYLKIPQYYFNEREDREYMDRIREILDQNVPPNEIHDLIFDFNPVHIITTNYDNLIEKQYNIKLPNTKYIKVANDIELAAAPISNYIIKMHGEFENIVLKESDYDSYSSNFKLIETFIKGLFATHTILFVGFSCTDPNIRRLMQWVKDIVGSKHQPAYLIDTDKHDKISSEEFRIRHEYFKKQGIFTIYKRQVEKEVEDEFEKCQYKHKISLNGQGLELYKFLYFIKNYKYTDVDRYYQILCQLESLPVINSTILQKVFNADIPNRLYKHYNYPLENEQQKFELDMLRLKMALTCSDNINDVLDLLKFNSVLKEKYKNVVDNNFKIKNEGDEKKFKDIIAEIKKEYPTTKEETTKIKYIYNVIQKAQKYENQINISKYLKFEIQDSNKEETNYNKKEKLFNKAFDLYNMHKYVDAFNLLCLISNDFQNDPIIFYIAEFNKKTIAGNIKWENGLIKKISDEEKRVAENYDKIDLDRIINHKIPESIREVIKLFTIENIQNKYATFIECADNIKSYKKLLENGGSGFNDYCQKLCKELYSFFNYTIGNYIFINRYKQTCTLFYHIVEAILESYTTKACAKNNFINFGVNKIENLNYFEFFIMIEFLSNKQLKFLLENLKITNINISTKENTKELLISAFTNYLLKVMNCNGIDISDTIENFLTIFSLIDIKVDEFKNIINKYNQFIDYYIPYSKEIDSYNYRGKIHKDLADFIINVTAKYIDNKIKIPNDLYEEIIDKYKDINTLSENDYVKLISNCVKAIANTKKHLLKKQSIIDFYIDNSDRIKNSDVIIVDLYLISNEINKKKIKNYFKQKKYKNITAENSYLIFSAVNNKIITYTATLEKNLFNTIDIEIKNHIYLEHESSSDSLITLSNCLLNFALNHKIKNKNNFKELVSKLHEVKFNNEANLYIFNEIIRLLDFTINPAEYNFENAEITDFQYFDKIYIKEIKNIESLAKLLLKNLDLKQENTYTRNDVIDKITKILDFNEYMKDGN